MAPLSSCCQLALLCDRCVQKSKDYRNGWYWSWFVPQVDIGQYKLSCLSKCLDLALIPEPCKPSCTQSYMASRMCCFTLIGGFVGLQTFVMTMQGPAVALAAQGHFLAVVWHSGLPVSSDDQCLQYAVFDVSQQTQVTHHKPCCSRAYHLCTSVSLLLHMMRAHTQAVISSAHAILETLCVHGNSCHASAKPYATQLGSIDRP